MFLKVSDHLKTAVCSCSCVCTWWNAAAAGCMVMMLAVRYSDGTAGESCIIPQCEKPCHWQLILLPRDRFVLQPPSANHKLSSKAVYTVKASDNISKTIQD